MLFMFSMLTACQSSALNFSEVKDVPDKVQDEADPKKELQSIEDEKGTYIILHANGDVEPDVETEGDTVSIDFHVSDSSGNGIKQNTYYITTDEEHDTMDASVNGESTYFDESTV